MSTKPTGGTAFPLHDTGHPRAMPHHGMTLRDYFAAAAMRSEIMTGNVCAEDIPRIAMASYAMADAMIAEREKT